MSNVNLWLDLENAPIGPKFNRKDPDNILNRLNLLSRSFKVKG